MAMFQVLFTLVLYFQHNTASASKSYFNLGEIPYGHDASDVKYQQESVIEEGEVAYGEGYESGKDPNYRSNGDTKGSHGFQYGSQFSSPIQDDYDQWDEWGVISDPDLREQLKKKQSNPIRSRPFIQLRFGYIGMAIVFVCIILLFYGYNSHRNGYKKIADEYSVINSV
eukprot:746688_1